MYLFNFIIPIAQGFVTDDMGWRESSCLVEAGGPPRLHTDRNATIEEYREFVRLAKTCGTRICAPFVLSEWDRNGICAKKCYNMPQAPMNITEYGTDWQNQISKTDTEIMDYVKENASYIDFALHGVRHGHFGSGQWENGEWARRAKKDDNGNFCEDIKTVTPWDSENNTNRLTAQCYREILRQYFTEEELTFPESFVPPNHAYYYEPEKDTTTGAVLSDFGVKYCNFKMSGSGAGDYIYFDSVVNYDHNLCMLDRRGLKNCSYKKTGAAPKLPPRAYPWIEVHFNNVWDQTDHFSKYLYSINRFPNRMLGKNTEQVFSQWIFRNFAKIKNRGSSFALDLTDMPQEAFDRNIVSNITLKIFLGNKNIEYISSDKGLSLTGYSKDRFGFGYLTLGSYGNEMGAPKKDIYTFEYRAGKSTPLFYADTSFCTACLYGTETKKNSYILKAKIYRNQDLKIKCPKPENVSVSNQKISIVSSEYRDGFLYLSLKGVSMLGDITDIIINSKSPKFW